jgi:uncharacterized Fe-S cluster protein YjdI
MERKFEYSNGEITIIWQPHLCMHSRVCVKTLPEVYKPDERPWINPHNATTVQLIDQVNHCPSRALSFIFNKEKEE